MKNKIPQVLVLSLNCDCKHLARNIKECIREMFDEMKINRKDYKISTYDSLKNQSEAAGPSVHSPSLPSRFKIKA